MDAKTEKLDSKLTATNRKLNKIDKSVDKVDTDFKRMASTLVTGAVAASASLGVLVNSTVRFARELEVASRRNGVAVETMQALAFASQTVGISLEKLGDIGKDTNEKIGEFLATGGGGFVDFIDVMKLTSAEGRELAKTFSTMSGTDVLQEMVKQMEAAGISSNQMSFALEGLASDATDLIPLLSGNAEQLEKLKTNFAEVGAVLSQKDIDKIKEVGLAFNELGHSFSAGGRQMIADYSEELIIAVELITTLGIRSSEVFNIISTGWGNIVELGQAALTDFINGTETFAQVAEERAKLSSETIEKLGQDATRSLEISVTKGTQAVKKGTKEDKQGNSEKLDQFSKYTKAAGIIQSAFFEDNKALQAGIIIADTAAAVMKSLSVNPYDYANVAILVATGAAQLSQALSASPGGGSVSGASSGGGGGSGFTPDPQSFQQETSSLELTDSGSSGSQVTAVPFTTDSGDELMDVISKLLNERKAQGRT